MDFSPLPSLFLPMLRVWRQVLIRARAMEIKVLFCQGQFSRFVIQVG